MNCKRLLSAFLCAATLAAGAAYPVYSADSETAPAETPALSEIFSDTADDAWYSEYVYYAYTRGLVTGKGEGTFAPGESMTRAQLVTILYRMEGSPEVKFEETFADVSEGDWFADSVLWASQNGVVSGKGEGRFAPGDSITREQIAMILYRYAESRDYDVTGRDTRMDKFPDNDSISSYAAEAMSWAVGEKIITGKAVDDSTVLSPQGLATRAEVSVMLQRFIEDYSLKARPYAEYTVAPNVLPENMKLYGVLPDLSRIPDDALEGINEGVVGWEKSSTGGRVKFKTDSDAISIDVLLDADESSFGCGIDILVDGVLAATFNPLHSAKTDIHGKLMLDDGSGAETHEITVYLTRNIKTTELKIGLDTWAKVEEPTPYKNEGKPVVFYGSSITQGSGSSSPSKEHVAVTCEMLGLDFINLGFGGSALGEAEMAEYIATLEMSAFVMEYDYNAPTLEHLKNTHKPFFDIIRKAQPDLPILIISAPPSANAYLPGSGFVARRRVVMDTFYSALDAGDTKVAFIDGFSLFGTEELGLCFGDSDDVHPSDIGYDVMAKVIAPRLKELMERS